MRGRLMGEDGAHTQERTIHFACIHTNTSSTIVQHLPFEYRDCWYVQPWHNIHFSWQVLQIVEY